MKNLYKKTMVLAVVLLVASVGRNSNADKMNYQPAMTNESKPQLMTIGATAMSEDSKPLFSTLVTAVVAVDKANGNTALQDALQGKDKLTLFAPNNKAFEKLPAGTLQSLLDNPKELEKILMYHIVPGKLSAAKVMSERSLKTLEGSPLKIEVKGNEVILNGTSSVVKADIKASNGYIHEIDTILMPPVSK